MQKGLAGLLIRVDWQATRSMNPLWISSEKEAKFVLVLVPSSSVEYSFFYIPNSLIWSRRTTDDNWKP